MRNSRTLKLIVIILLLVVIFKDTELLAFVKSVLNAVTKFLIKALTLLGELFK